MHATWLYQLPVRCLVGGDSVGAAFGALSKTVHARCGVGRRPDCRKKAKVRHSDMHFLTPIRDYVSRLFWFKLVWVGQAMSDICTILDTHPPSCIAFAARPPRVRGQHSPQFGPAVCLV